MLSGMEQILLILFILATATAFILPVTLKIRIILSGLPEKRIDRVFKRFWSALTKVLFQRCTLKNERVWTGIMHVFIFYGALTFDTATVNHTFEGFFPDFFLFGKSSFGLFFSFLVDMFAILVLIGVAFLIFRRFIVRPKAYATTPLDSAAIYILLITATLSYLYFEAFSIIVHPQTERLAFLGGILAGWINNTGISASAAALHFKISWWLHLLIVYGFIAYVPHSKYFHMFAGPFNLFFKDERAMNSLKALNIEESEVFGVEKAVDFTWKDLLDAFSCMECGRCQDACPAFSTDKALSPKMIIFNLREHLLKQKKHIMKKDRETLPSLMDNTYKPDEIWACTTCGSCMHVCPVEIEHIPKIIGIRQSQVLMEGNFPQELNLFFRSMETNSNPWGIGFAERADWMEGLNVKTLNEHSGAEYLLWVGCTGSFDEQGKKITAAMVDILNTAEIDFAVLGKEEKCCGDSVKRLGNEYLFQMMAQENIQLFDKYGIKKIITFCPHGFNVFKNEYPRLIDILPDLSQEQKINLKKIEIIHHTELIACLYREGRLKLNPVENRLLTYHDSCYLGRHNGIIKSPRIILSEALKANLVELDDNKEHSFCCGAGGGLMWTEETQGKRINHMRTEQILKKQPQTVCTSCPFCHTMLLDGLKDKEKENISVLDIAQLVSSCLEKREK